MVDDETLERMLRGEDGVAALDCAREIRALRAQVETLCGEADLLRASMFQWQDIAQQFQSDHAAASAKHAMLCDALADLLAGHRTPPPEPPDA